MTMTGMSMTGKCQKKSTTAPRCHSDQVDTLVDQRKIDGILQFLSFLPLGKRKYFRPGGSYLGGQIVLTPVLGDQEKLMESSNFYPFSIRKADAFTSWGRGEIFRGQIFYHPSREADFFRDNFFKKCQKSPFFFILGGFRAFYFSNWKFIKRRGQGFFSTLRWGGCRLKLLQPARHYVRPDVNSVASLKSINTKILNEHTQTTGTCMHAILQKRTH